MMASVFFRCPQPPPFRPDWDEQNNGENRCRYAYQRRRQHAKQGVTAKLVARDAANLAWEIAMFPCLLDIAHGTPQVMIR